MTVSTIAFTTGPSVLPDVGELSYNGCLFGPYFVTDVSGIIIKDEANRTTKLMEYTLKVDGYVTLVAGFNSINPTMVKLQTLLTQQAGQLIYVGRGFDMIINEAGASVFGDVTLDVAWGPEPKLIEFQPLGGGLSAKVRWTVTTRVVWPNQGGKVGLLQFNCETAVSYNEDYFSSLSVRGTMEIPLTRVTPGTRTVTSTVDDFRSQLDTRIFAGIDLARFRVVKRSYPISRDKRTMTIDVQCEEKPYMDLPVGSTVAHGTFSVRKKTAGFGFALWMCTLRATYVVQANAPRRMSWWAFLALLRCRMNQSIAGTIPGLTAAQVPQLNAQIRKVQNLNKTSPVPPRSSLTTIYSKILNQQASLGKPINAQIFDFGFEEGLYEDSKSMSYYATWQITSDLSSILLASGLWVKLPEEDTRDNNLWAMSMGSVSGSTSWMTNRLDPGLDIIVDFGGG